VVVEIEISFSKNGLRTCSDLLVRMIVPYDYIQTFLSVSRSVDNIK